MAGVLYPLAYTSCSGGSNSAASWSGDEWIRGVSKIYKEKVIYIMNSYNHFLKQAVPCNDVILVDYYEGKMITYFKNIF